MCIRDRSQKCPHSVTHEQPVYLRTHKLRGMNSDISCDLAVNSPSPDVISSSRGLASSSFFACFEDRSRMLFDGTCLSFRFCLRPDCCFPFLGAAPRGGNSAGDSRVPGASPDCCFCYFHIRLDASDSVGSFAAVDFLPGTINASGCLDCLP